MKYVKNCPITGEPGIELFKFYTPLAGSFLKSKYDINKEVIYPLTLSFYEKSGLVMVNERIPPETLFANYFYKSGVSISLVNHFKELYNYCINSFSFSKVAEIGCNDFSLLSMFKDKSFVLGIDPSDIAKNNSGKCNLINDFFSFSLSEDIRSKYGFFDLIISTNSFAHIDDIMGAAKGVHHILSEDGVFVIEVHWLKKLLENKQFPFIYHEHIYYYSLKSLTMLLKKAGLNVFDAKLINTHGGSLRVFASKKIKNNTKELTDLLKEEESFGCYSLEKLKTFFDEIASYTSNIKETLKKYKNKNKRVIGYGASGQSTTFLNMLGISNKEIDFLVDDSPLKIGRISPGTHLEIKSKDCIDTKNDIIFVLAYTFFNEIQKKIGKAHYIIPLPTLIDTIHE